MESLARSPCEGRRSDFGEGCFRQKVPNKVLSVGRRWMGLTGMENRFRNPALLSLAASSAGRISDEG